MVSKKAKKMKLPNRQFAIRPAQTVSTDTGVTPEISYIRHPHKEG